MNLQDEAYQYLYSDEGVLHLMNMETFDEIELPASACEGGEESVAMLEGITINLS